MGEYVLPPLAIPEYASDDFPPDFRERTVKAAVSSEWRPISDDLAASG